MSDFFDPSDNTPLGFEGDKETFGGSASFQSPWHVGQELGDFVLQAVLGSGSSGFVYRAIDRKAGRSTALKLLRQDDPDVLVRNRLGFRRMMQVEHPNLLRVDRIYHLGSYTALAMEEVNGVTFAKAMSVLKKLPRQEGFQRLLELLRDFASGLAAMHAAGFIHRDIKPQNLMVDQWGRGRIIDYGLVESFDLNEANISDGNFLLGTPHYMAPEVLYKQLYLPAGDIFSVGIMMLEALRVLAYVPSEEFDEVTDLQRSSTSREDYETIDVALGELSDEVPRLIADTCREMLERHPSDRPTAMALARLGLPPKAILPSLLSEDLIGRESQIDEMHAWIDSVFSGAVSRFHVTGPSGIGKTRLLDEAIQYIESKNWGQVFRGRCRLREDSALQAFEQICDAIAARYMRPDREPLVMDNVSAEILWGIFPVLRNTITVCMDFRPIDSSKKTRLDSLEAAARMSVKLREMGPLFIVIDDAQWADQDSLNVLDRLQGAAGEIGLGIITVSRPQPDPQKVAADKTIKLGPIGKEYLVKYLAAAAQKWAIPISDAALSALADATDGSPFRLKELTNEFRPGGTFSQLDFDAESESAMAVSVSIDKLWQNRLGRLSDDAKRVLLYVVTAGGRVSTDQLSELTGLGDSIDAAVSELSQLRLIIDEATGGECISIYHDRFAEHITDSLPANEKKKANGDWASLLVRKDNPESLAARIAGHWFAAGQPGRAVSHAILAAEEAERRIAKTEAARWHAKVIDHVSGDEKVHHIRQAARCYHEADIPVEAARYFQMLSAATEGEERFESLLSALVMLLRCGKFELVREEIGNLATSLGLPRPKSPWLAKTALVWNSLRLVGRGRTLMEKLASSSNTSRTSLAELPSVIGDVEGQYASQQDSEDRKHLQRLELCIALARPMSMFDNLYAAELSLCAARLARQQGSQGRRIRVASGEAVFGSYDRGPKRVTSMTDLLSMLPIANANGDYRAKGDVWSALAFSHALSCQWQQVELPMHSGVENYRQFDQSLGFEIAHVRWAGLWALWNLGRWSSLTTLSDEMFDEAQVRNDMIQQQITYSGWGASSWLVRDQAEELETLRDRHTQEVDLGPGEILNFFHHVGRIHHSIYNGQYFDAWNLYLVLESRTRRLPFAKIQCLRVLRQSLGALIALHCNQEDANQEHAITGAHFDIQEGDIQEGDIQEGDIQEVSGKRQSGLNRRSPGTVWGIRVGKFSAELRAENLTYSRILADFYDGTLCSQCSDVSQSEQMKGLAIHFLRKSQSAATQTNLHPIGLASADLLAHLMIGESMGLLRERMVAKGVVAPDKLARLYTVSPR